MDFLSRTHSSTDYSLFKGRNFTVEKNRTPVFDSKLCAPSLRLLGALVNANYWLPKWCSDTYEAKARLRDSVSSTERPVLWASLALGL